MRRTRPISQSALAGGVLLICLSGDAVQAGGTLYYCDIFNPDPSFGSIRRVNTDGTEPVALLDTGGGLRGFDVDLAAGKMYWCDVNNYVIRRANLDGSNPEDLITTGLEFPMNITVDPEANKLYWGDMLTNIIGVANLDGSNADVLVNTPFHWGLALDKANGKLYWSTSDTMFKGRIQRCNLDGSGVETVVSSLDSEFKPAHITLSGGRIYWTDYVVDVVRRSNLDGSNREDLFYVGANENPRGIVVDADEGKVYWGQDTEFSGPNAVIMRMNLDGSNPEVAISDTGLPQDLFFVPDPPCPGDLNGDQVVDQSDLGVLLADFGCQPGGQIMCPDLDGDGDTDQSDLGIVLANFGLSCE